MRFNTNFLPSISFLVQSLETSSSHSFLSSSLTPSSSFPVSPFFPPSINPSRPIYPSSLPLPPLPLSPSLPPLPPSPSLFLPPPPSLSFLLTDAERRHGEREGGRGGEGERGRGEEKGTGWIQLLATQCLLFHWQDMFDCKGLPLPSSLPSLPPPPLPVLTDSLWRQLSEHTLSLLCNDSVCAPLFHSLKGWRGGRYHKCLLYKIWY